MLTAFHGSPVLWQDMLHTNALRFVCKEEQMQRSVGENYKAKKTLVEHYNQTNNPASQSWRSSLWLGLDGENFSFDRGNTR